MSIGVILAGVLGIALAFFRIQAIPEQIARRTSKVQSEFVCVLAFLGVVTQYDLLWVIALVLAFVDLPDFEAPLVRMAESLAKIARTKPMGSQGPKGYLSPFERLDALFHGEVQPANTDQAPAATDKDAKRALPAQSPACARSIRDSMGS